LRGFLADSGEMLQCVDKSFNGSGKIRHARCVAQGETPRKPSKLRCR
jgi:hypothetical protein